MKKTIVCICDGKMIGYWIDNSIRTRTIELYSNDEEKDLQREFLRAGLQIANKYGDNVIPVIAIVQTGGDVESLRVSAETHLKNVRETWPDKVERHNAVKEAIQKVKAFS